MKPLTLKEARDKGYWVWSFYNGDYSYEVDGIAYLISNGKEIAKGDEVRSCNNAGFEYSQINKNMKPLTLKEARNRKYYTYSFDNGDYKYEVDGAEHLIRNGEEIAKGNYVYTYPNSDYMYEIDGTTHKFNKDGEEITL